MGEDTSGEEAIKEVNRLRRRFDDHILDEQSWRQEYLLRCQKQEEAHEKNMEAIAKLTEATQGIVEAWKVVNGLQRFFKWLSGFSVLILILAFISKYIDMLQKVSP